MAVIEDSGDILVHGRYGGLQVPVDAVDTEVAIPTGHTHAEVHLETQFQELLYSITGLIDSWFVLPPGAKDGKGSPFRIALSGAAGVDPNRKIYFRKAKKIRHVSFRPGFSGRFAGAWDASTNTPTLANGTGHDKTYYSVSAAGSVDFGAGVIAFLVGDWVTYVAAAPDEWQKATVDPRDGICDDSIGKLVVTFTED